MTKHGGAVLVECLRAQGVRRVFAVPGESYLGALDAPERFSPSYECWTERREGWLPPFDGTHRFARDRD